MVRMGPYGYGLRTWRTVRSVSKWQYRVFRVLRLGTLHFILIARVVQLTFALNPPQQFYFRIGDRLPFFPPPIRMFAHSFIILDSLNSYIQERLQLISARRMIECSIVKSRVPNVISLSYRGTRPEVKV